ALRPAARGAGGEGDDGSFATADGVEAGGGEALKFCAFAGGRWRRDVVGARILDDGIGGQAILREADAAVAEGGADLLVSFAVEAVFGEQFIERALAGFLLAEARKQGIEEFLHHAAQLGPRAAGGGETIQ